MSGKKRRLGNGGFSLIELLVCVMILGVVTAPLFHAMVTSMRMTARSKQIQTQTLSAQNIAETFNANEMSDILRDITDDLPGMGALGRLTSDARVYTYDADEETYTAVNPATDPDHVAANGQLYYIGLKNVAFSTGTYDAMVKLDAGAYPSVNDAEVSIYTRMNAVFSQPAGSVQNPDSIAADNFASQAFFLSGEPVTAADFTHKMVRNIAVNIVRNGENVTASAIYGYSTHYTYALPLKDEDGNIMEDEDGNTIYDVPVTVELTHELSPYHIYAGTVDNFTSMHFFYYPNYNMVTSGGYDNITIYNNGGLEFTFFLAKQYTSGCEGYEAVYRASLWLKEPFDAERFNNKTPIATIYTNMNLILGSDNSPNPSEFRVYYGHNWYNLAFSSGQLVETDDLKRLYDVTVDLYPAGSDFSGDKLFTFNATKVE